MNAPIIFIHTGDSFYLKYTLKAAKLNNPDTEVILLGDEHNRKYKKHGITHVNYKDFYFGEDLAEFNKNYKEIRGREFKWKPEIMKFVFEKWFVLYNYVTHQQTGPFWTFDTDVMILDNLEKYRSCFQNIDYTYQCHLYQPQGLINNSEMIKKFMQTVNEKFTDEEFLRQNRVEFETINPGYALTIMRMFYELHKKGILTSTRVNKNLDNHIFDECLFYDNEDRFEMTNFRNSRTIKKMSIAKGGGLYLKEKNGPLLRAVVLNLSWLPEDIFYTIYRHTLSKKNREGAIKEFDYNHIPASFKACLLVRRLKNKIKKALIPGFKVPNSKKD